MLFQHAESITIVSLRSCLHSEQGCILDALLARCIHHPPYNMCCWHASIYLPFITWSDLSIGQAHQYRALGILHFTRCQCKDVTFRSLYKDELWDFRELLGIVDQVYTSHLFCKLSPCIAVTRRATVLARCCEALALAAVDVFILSASFQLDALSFTDFISSYICMMPRNSVSKGDCSIFRIVLDVLFLSHSSMNWSSRR